MKEEYHKNLAIIPGLTQAEDENVDEKSNSDTTFDSSNIESDISDKSEIDVCEDEYMPVTRLKNRDFELAEEDFSEYYTINQDYKAQLVRYGTIHYPKNWQIYYCKRGKFKKFPAPKEDASGLLSKFFSGLINFVS